MCKVSDQLKLCTCSTDINSVKHYWVFCRFVKGKKNIVIGEIMPPATIDPITHKFNQKLLTTLLNEGNPFDTDINPKEKDRLELSFTVTATNPERIFYGFEYRNNRWVKKEFDPLMWRCNHNEEMSGEIKNALPSAVTTFPKGITV